MVLKLFNQKAQNILNNDSDQYAFVYDNRLTRRNIDSVKLTN